MDTMEASSAEASGKMLKATQTMACPKCFVADFTQSKWFQVGKRDAKRLKAALQKSGSKESHSNGTSPSWARFSSFLKELPQLQVRPT